MRSKRFWLISGGIMILLGAGSTFWWLTLKNHSPIPKDISKGMSFTLYYPDKNKLPEGYVLDETSFEKQEGAIIYTVTDESTIFYFSLQKKPSDTEIKTFYSVHLPLKNELTTSVGTAAIGNLNNRTFVSLPTNTNTWIIITAASDADQGVLKQIVRSIHK